VEIKGVQLLLLFNARVEFKDQFNHVMLYAFGSGKIAQQHRVMYLLCKNSDV
jgi:hypothetical protein